MIDDDLPAAHSMDTTWFAVDASGHVAVFDSGEPGPVPEQGWAEQGADFELIALLVRDGRVPYQAEDLLARMQGRTLVEKWGTRELSEIDALSGRMLTFTDCLLWLVDEAAWAAVASLSEMRRLPVPGQVVGHGDVPLALAKEIHDAGTLRGLIVDHRLDLARFGFYCYDYGDYQARAPYQRSRQPLRPLRLEELPEDLRRRIAALRFEPVAFARDEHVEPRDHVRCVTWGG